MCIHPRRRRVSLHSLHASPHRLFVTCVYSWRTNSRLAQRHGRSPPPKLLNRSSNHFLGNPPRGSVTHLRKQQEQLPCSDFARHVPVRSGVHAFLNATLRSALNALFADAGTVRMTIAPRRKMSCRSGLSKLAVSARLQRLPQNP